MESQTREKLKKLREELQQVATEGRAAIAGSQRVGAEDALHQIRVTRDVMSSLIDLVSAEIKRIDRELE